MNGVTAIMKKEARSYFYSPVAYIFIGVFVFFMGITFYYFVVRYQQYALRSRFGGEQGISLERLVSALFQNMGVILAFMTPAFAMKTFAEERRQNTLELLFTAPLRGFELVIGKFLSSMSVVLVMIAASLLYIGFLVMWGNPDLKVVACTYLGLILSMGCYLSIGMLISAMCTSQAVAFIIDIVVVFVLWILPSIAQAITLRTGPIEWGTVVGYLAPLSHYNAFAEGVIHLKDVVYNISFITVMLFLTYKVVESNRWR